jgi:hypothetical protein
MTRVTEGGSRQALEPGRSTPLEAPREDDSGSLFLRPTFEGHGRDRGFHCRHHGRALWPPSDRRRVPATPGDGVPKVYVRGPRAVKPHPLQPWSSRRASATGSVDDLATEVKARPTAASPGVARTGDLRAAQRWTRQARSPAFALTGRVGQDSIRLGAEVGGSGGRSERQGPTALSLGTGGHGRESAQRRVGRGRLVGGGEKKRQARVCP